MKNSEINAGIVVGEYGGCENLGWYSGRKACGKSISPTQEIPFSHLIVILLKLSFIANLFRISAELIQTQGECLFSGHLMLENVQNFESLVFAKSK